MNKTQTSITTDQNRCLISNHRRLSVMLCSLGLSLSSLLGFVSSAKAVTITDLPLTGENGSTLLNLHLNPNKGVQLSWQPVADGSDDVEFCLQLSNGISWWKAIKVFNQKHQFQGLLARSDAAKKEQCETFSQEDISNGGNQSAKVEFWKAMAFGAHTHIDSLNFEWDQVSGKRIIFDWLAD